MISCEYPPQIGGVGNYVASVAAGLAGAGHHVHVWCPSAETNGPEPAGVIVHRELGTFGPRDLRRTGLLLDAFPAPRRLLVQWVPHGYGYRSMNLRFCTWARGRARKGDRVDVMVHEPFLPFDGNWKQYSAAAVHRVMTATLLGAARRVWVSTPAWRSALEPYAFGRQLGFEWLPVPSPVEPVDDPDGVTALRARYASGGARVIGHFGIYSRLTAAPMKEIVPLLLARIPGAVVLLIGQSSTRLREEILETAPQLASRLHAAGVLALPDLSRHLQACDLFVQPYPEGITSRRTSSMAALAHGRPIVATEGDATEPQWRERGAVALVRAGDAPAIVAEVERLAADPRARAVMGSRARTLYEDCFDVRHTLDALLAS